MIVPHLDSEANGCYNALESMELATQTVNLPAKLPIYDHFTADKKRLFLDTFAKTPNLTGVAEALGHSRQVIFYHLERDPEFKKEFEAVKEGLVDVLEGKVYEYGQRPQNFMDRIAYLRAFRPERWAPQPTLSLNVNLQQSERLAGNARQFIETTATPTDKPTP